MDVAYTTKREGDTSHDVVCVVAFVGVPRKGDVVEISDTIYVVDDVEWHIDVVEGGSPDFINGELMDIIVRLTKTGEA